MAREGTSPVKKLWHVLTVLGLAGFLIPGSAAADPNDAGDLFDMSIEELMEVEVGVASLAEWSQRESPGAVFVMTRDQIQKSGFRDLVDILRLVPGFDVGFDTSGAFGVAIRGMWANEGKVLVLMDGIELNDDMYSTFQYGHHIPADIIERIEVMRGPGSAIYGESAELGVISITTISPKKREEAFVNSIYSHLREKFGRKGVTAYYGAKEEDTSVSVISHYETGNFTDRTARSYDTMMTSVDLGDDGNSRVRDAFFNIGVKKGNLSVRGIIDRYSLNSPYPGYSMYKMGFDSDILQVKYKMPITDSFSVISKFLYKHQQPWNYPTVTYSGGSVMNKISSDKYAGDVHFSYESDGGHTLIGGMTYDETRGRDRMQSGLFGGGKNEVKYYNAAIYGEGTLKTSWGNFTVGGRHVKHNYAGSKFVPRVAWTKVFGKYHAKAMFSQAYRNPSVMNIAYNPMIKPEETTTYEFEVGVRPTENLQLTANAFDMEIKNPIVYFYSGSSNYTNFDETGTRGVELAANYKKDECDLVLTYSCYKAKHNKVSEYAVPGHSGNLLGFPQHKLSLLASFNPCKDVFITPSLTYFGSRYAVTNYTSDYVYEKLDPKLLTNVSLLCKDAFKKKGLDLSFSVFNVFDEKYDYIEPYLGWYGPIPGPSRAFVFELMYRFK